MKHLILTISLIFGATAVSAAERETWLCDGFKATSDGSSYLGPFIMYGTQKSYEWKHRNYWSTKLNFVGQNLLSNFDIYVGFNSDEKDKYEYAYYIVRNTEIVDKLKIINFIVPIKGRPPHYFETDCLRQ